MAIVQRGMIIEIFTAYSLGYSVPGSHMTSSFDITIVLLWQLQ